MFSGIRFHSLLVVIALCSQYNGRRRLPYSITQRSCDCDRKVAFDNIKNAKWVVALLHLALSNTKIVCKKIVVNFNC